MNLIHIIVSKVSATISVILLSFGLVQPPIVEQIPVEDPVEIVINTHSTSSPVTIKKTQRSTPPLPVTPAKEEAPVVGSSTVQVTVQATVQDQSLPTSSVQVPQPVITPQVVIVQVEQQATLPTVGSTQTPTMGKLYQITKGEVNETVVLDDATEQAVRDFAEGLNQQINWRKQVRSIDMDALAEALKANGYTLTEK